MCRSDGGADRTMLKPRTMMVQGRTRMVQSVGARGNVRASFTLASLFHKDFHRFCEQLVTGTRDVT
jgi:hypothetical protein